MIPLMRINFIDSKPFSSIIEAMKEVLCYKIHEAKSRILPAGYHDYVTTFLLADFPFYCSPLPTQQ